MLVPIQAIFFSLADSISLILFDLSDVSPIKGRVKRFAERCHVFNAYKSGLFTNPGEVLNPMD